MLESRAESSADGNIGRRVQLASSVSGPKKIKENRIPRWPDTWCSEKNAYVTWQRSCYCCHLKGRSDRALYGVSETVSYITLVDLQLDAKILIYLHIIHLLKSSTCFEHYPAHLQEVYVVICIYAASGIITLCTWLSCAPVKKEWVLLNRCTRQSPAESDDTRGCIYTITA